MIACAIIAAAFIIGSSLDGLRDAIQDAAEAYREEMKSRRETGARSAAEVARAFLGDTKK